MKFIANGVELAALDSIVSDMKERFNKRITDYVAQNPTPVSEATATAQEDAWIEDLNAKYNERVVKTVGRKVPENWKEGKDNVVVRKRILNRELNAMRGKLFQAYDAAQAALALNVSKQLDDLTASSEAYLVILKAKLPMDRQELTSTLERHKTSLITSVNDLYSGGLEKLEADTKICKGTLFSALLSEALATKFEHMEAANEVALSELTQKLDTLVSSCKDMAESFKEAETILLPVHPNLLSNRAGTLRDRLKTHIEVTYEGGVTAVCAHFKMSKDLDFNLVLDGLVNNTVAILTDINARKSAEVVAKVKATTVENIASQIRKAMQEITAANVEIARTQLGFLSSDSLASFALSIEEDAKAVSFK